jgi:multidrug efflux pump subunit AcrB
MLACHLLASTGRKVDDCRTASSVGQTRIVLQFGLDRDIDGAARDVQAAIIAAHADVPTSLKTNQLTGKCNHRELSRKTWLRGGSCGSCV